MLGMEDRCRHDHYFDRLIISQLQREQLSLFLERCLLFELSNSAPKESIISDGGLIDPSWNKQRKARKLRRLWLDTKLHKRKVSV